MSWDGGVAGSDSPDARLLLVRGEAVFAPASRAGGQGIPASLRVGTVLAGVLDAPHAPGVTGA
jgi:hypothetical protein